jgi:hypothetical protein
MDGPGSVRLANQPNFFGENKSADNSFQQSKHGAFFF